MSSAKYRPFCLDLNVWGTLFKMHIDISRQQIWNLLTTDSSFICNDFEIKAAMTALLIVQWNLSATTTSITKSITCDLFSNVF